MFPRQLVKQALQARQGYPALLVAGPRQSGKTTFVRETFAGVPYKNFESPLERASFKDDPLRFLEQFPSGAILDEVQHVPELLSFLQVRIDNDRRMGQWILTGSHQIDLMRGASQSLAGRLAILELLPFSHNELSDSPRRPLTPNQAILQGGYPPLYDEERQLDPADWLENYLSAFVQRDVRAILQPRNAQAFDRFLRICAAITGQELNKSKLADKCEVDRKTIEQWLGALEACFVIRLTRPYHKNFGKRLVKRPKLHFLDSGLACRLLHISDVNQLDTHPLRGALFETWCFTEVQKHFSHHGRKDPLWHWRSNDGTEIDFLIQRGNTLIPIEIKAGMTPRPNAAKGIEKLRDLNTRDKSVEVARGLVLYGGREPSSTRHADFVPWNVIGEALEELK